ncbi:MAG: helix-turn-helix domain-containing protein [Clostridia bacterium]|nr:helix-turn-helix domain-containing protein [Clostridia bacterium]
MKDKKSFGLFIAEKRREQNLTQKELAEKLYVTKTAVSKWERGVTYPDITLISELCAVLKVDEHEMIAESDDGKYRRMRTDAKKYRRISDIYFYGLCAAYALSLVICFICNLAVDKTLSWFFIVLCALITAFTLFPSVSRFLRRYKLLVVVLSFTAALILLLLSCCLTLRGSWFFIAATSVLLGLTCVFLPIFIAVYPVHKKVKRHAPIICIAADFALLLAVLASCLHAQPQTFLRAAAVSFYALAPIVLCAAVVCYTRINAYFKSAVLSAVCGVAVFFADVTINKIFAYDNYEIAINLLDWSNRYINGNIHLIILVCALIAAAVLTALGIKKALSRR